MHQFQGLQHAVKLRPRPSHFFLDSLQRRCRCWQERRTQTTSSRCPWSWRPTLRRLPLTRLSLRRHVAHIFRIHEHTRFTLGRNRFSAPLLTTATDCEHRVHLRLPICLSLTTQETCCGWLELGEGCRHISPELAAFL
ncbi:hypothetical protein BDZ89DRAFT_648639 [Hymenopellis radicata]|nr:hypothetical protein BDZ89DRAFT_648639 [Hymenopellis radicata]